MRLLFTSDWQIAFGNLQECEMALDELIAAAVKYQPEAVIHAGDVKPALGHIDKTCYIAVSYTHLDVYKRQL